MPQSTIPFLGENMKSNYEQTLIFRFHFEVWAGGQGLTVDKMPSGEYWDNRTEDMWRGWIGAVKFLGLPTFSSPFSGPAQ